MHAFQIDLETTLLRAILNKTDTAVYINIEKLRIDWLSLKTNELLDNHKAPSSGCARIKQTR